MTPAQILQLPLPERARQESGATTISGYLVALVEAMWGDPAGNVDSKRPFGSSSWRHDLYRPLIDAGVIAGAYDEDGYLEHCDDVAGDQLIRQAIATLGATALVEVAIAGPGLEGPLEEMVVVAPAGQDPEHTAMAVVSWALWALDQQDPDAARRVAAWAAAQDHWTGPQDMGPEAEGRG